MSLTTLARPAPAEKLSGHITDFITLNHVILYPGADVVGTRNLARPFFEKIEKSTPRKKGYGTFFKLFFAYLPTKREKTYFLSYLLRGFRATSVPGYRVQTQSIWADL